jgi:hypothetical protein
MEDSVMALHINDEEKTIQLVHSDSNIQSFLSLLSTSKPVSHVNTKIMVKL